MTKRKKTTTLSKTTPKDKQKGRRQEVQQPQTREDQKKRRVPRMMLGLISFLVGIFGFLFLVYPRIALYPGESLNSHNPFQTPFIIKNDGYLPIFNVDYLLNVENMEDINKNRITIGSTDQSNRGVIARLNPNKTSALFINRTVVVPLDYIKYIEANIIIKYKLFPVSPIFTEKIRFKTERKNTGEYIWFEDYAK